MNAELRQQPVADEGADQADDQIADQAKLFGQVTEYNAEPK